MKTIPFIFIAIIFCTSCTSILWDRSSYIENIHSLYIEEDSSSFVVLGDSHHYIFKAGEELINILKASKSIKIKPVLYYFDLSKNNAISGKLDLVAYKNQISTKDVSLLKNLGFDDSTSYNKEMLWYKTEIKGTRYLADSKINIKGNLSKSYQVKIFEPRTDGMAKTTGKVLLTPISVVTDVTLVVFGGILYGINFK